MTQQIVCDECGEPIDQSVPYYELSGSKVQMEGDPPSLTTVEPAKTMHYHEEHLAQNVLEPAPPSETPVEEPVEEPEEPPDEEEGDEEKPERYLDSADPDEGPEGGGMSITLHGGGFTGTGEVRFEQDGSVQHAWGFQVVDDSTITVTVPPGKGTVDIVLVENQEVVRLEDGFTYV